MHASLPGLMPHRAAIVSPVLNGNEITRLIICSGPQGISEPVESMLKRDICLDVIFHCNSLTTVGQLKTLPTYDIAIVDIDHGSISAGAQIRMLSSCYPNRPVVGITHSNEFESIRQAIAAGASGIVHAEDLQSGRFRLNLMQTGKCNAALSPQIARLLLNQIRLHSQSTSEPLDIQHPTRPDTQKENERPALSPREREVLRLSTDGLIGKEIARVLSVSPHTVTTHFKNIYRKLKVNTRGEAVFRAHTAGLI